MVPPFSNCWVCWGIESVVGCESPAAVVVSTSVDD